MYKFRFFFFLLFLLLSYISFSQNDKVFIKPEKVLYKSTKQGDLNLYFYRPLDFDKSKTYNCIIFFHGGGWNSGDYKQFERQSMYFASRGMIAISAEYRIKNKHGTTPIQAMEDAKSAIRFLRLNAKSFFINPNRIAAAGGSAGGHLAAVTANIDLFDNVNEDLGISSKPNLLVLYNPVIDFGSRKWLWIDNPSDASPVHNISKGSPPTIILTGTNDKIVPVETIMNYKKIMESVGSRCDVILYDGAEHAFFNRGEDFIDTVLKSDIFLKSNWYLEGKPTIKQQY
ncbi:MAG: alpha/beta hydrolase [Flavobacteriaceae bacterium]|tara:strand:+ start:1431 stop:2285 length:855 start_codon:yes stop_codon:yes gene_type:complete